MLTPTRFIMPSFNGIAEIVLNEESRTINLIPVSLKIIDNC